MNRDERKVAETADFVAVRVGPDAAAEVADANAVAFERRAEAAEVGKERARGLYSSALFCRDLAERYRSGGRLLRFSRPMAVA